jgi:hypothetical protein
MKASITHLRIMFDDDEIPEIVIPIPKLSSQEFYSFGSEQMVTLPNGEVLDVHAEISLESAIADISLSILEEERLFAVRCGSGVVFRYTTRSGFQVLLQIGTGQWDK